jgi:hypothetical protein
MSANISNYFMAKSCAGNIFGKVTWSWMFSSPHLDCGSSCRKGMEISVIRWILNSRCIIIVFNTAYFKVIVVAKTEKGGDK